MGIFFQEMVFHLPGIVIATLIGDLDLGEGILKVIILTGGILGPRDLMLVKNAEFHD